MLTDTSWWAAQVSDSVVRVTWEHVLPSADETEQFILSKTSIPDIADADYHPDTEDLQRWVFEAPHGLPVRYEQSWYRGDMAYGSDLAIDWEWELTNNGAVELAVADWVAPEGRENPRRRLWLAAETGIGLRKPWLRCPQLVLRHRPSTEWI